MALESEYLGINIDYSRDALLPEKGKVMLTKKGFYKKPHEESPQQTFARAATSYCFGDYNFAQRIYDAVSKGWFTFASPVLSNAAEVDWTKAKHWFPERDTLDFNHYAEWAERNILPDGMPISCFEAGTPVMTEVGEKPIECVVKGDKVLTHKGRFREVVATRESKSNDLYKLRVTGKSTPMNVTGNHKILTNKGWVRVDELIKGHHLVATNSKVESETLDQITFVVNDGSTTPYNSTSYQRTLGKTDVEFTEDLAWALGFWFAEGSTSDNGTISVTNQSKELITKWNTIMEESFGVKANLVNPKGRNWLNGRVCNKNLQEFFDKTFLKGCYNKRLTIDLMRMSESHFKEFFDGFYAGDGFKTSSNKAFELANTVFVSQLSLLLSKYGFKHSLQLRKKTAREEGYNGIVVIHKEQGKTGTRSGIDMPDGLTYQAIDSLEQLEGRESLVYDIQVDEDESFSVAGVVVHNCFLSYIGDSKIDLVESRKETAWLSMLGGGIGVYAGMRSPDEKSTGVMSHMRGYDADALSYKQTESRRGSIAAYLDITHPEIINFLEMRNPVGGDMNKKCFNLNNAVCIPDSFMEAVVKGEEYELIDPKHGKSGRTLDAREVWHKLLEIRKETGEPFIMWKDTVNRNIPKWITRPLYEVSQSNLCSEITLMTSKKRTAVCCLSSLNLEKYDEWKDSGLVADLVRLLDNVLEYFIRLAPPELHRAVNSARKERAIGLGTLGFHSYLQSKMIPFESGGFNSATQHNHKIYSNIKAQAIEESKRLATERGEPRDCKGSGMRNSHLMAIAPNASSSDMVGVSPSIEPWAANCFTAQGRAGSFLVKNKWLEKLLYEKATEQITLIKGMDSSIIMDEDIWVKHQWKSILDNDGSVQHLKYLTDEEKRVFKTFVEIDPMWLVEHVAGRQQYICQAQSFNIKVPATISAQRMSDIHMKAWAKGVKTLYYCRSEAPNKASVSVSQPKPIVAEEPSCISCEG